MFLRGQKLTSATFLTLKIGITAFQIDDPPTFKDIENEVLFDPQVVPLGNLLLDGRDQVGIKYQSAALVLSLKRVQLKTHETFLGTEQVNFTISFTLKIIL